MGLALAMHEKWLMVSILKSSFVSLDKIFYNAPFAVKLDDVFGRSPPAFLAVISMLLCE